MRVDGGGRGCLLMSRLSDLVDGILAVAAFARVAVHQCPTDGALVRLVRALVLPPHMELQEVVAHSVRGRVAVIVEIVLRVVRVFGDGTLQLLFVGLLACVFAACCAKKQKCTNEEKKRRGDCAHDNNPYRSACDKVSFALRINTWELATHSRFKVGGISQHTG